MTKPFQVKITFQVTEEVTVEASSPDEAVRQAIEEMDARSSLDRFVWADVEPSDEQR